MRATLGDLFARIPSSPALKSDPLGLGFPCTMFPELASSSASVGSANRIQYRRVRGGGAVTKLRIQVAVQSGNVCLSIYRNTGSGLSATPGSLLVTSGSVACPAAGQADVTLAGGPFTITNSDFWFALSADNTTATFSGGSTNGNMNDGWAGFQDSGFTAPTTPSLTTGGNRFPLIVGVP